MLTRRLAPLVLLLGLAAPARAGFALLVVNTEAQNVVILNAAGQPTVFASSGLNFPQFAAFDAAGNVYVSNVGNINTVEEFSPTGADLGTFASSGLVHPDGLAFDAAGNLYVANTFAGSIEKFSPTGTDLGTVASGLPGPVGLAFDAAGNLYAAIEGSGTIEKFSPSGADLGTFASSGGSAPIGLAFDAAGNLYVSNANSNTVEKISPTGTDLGTFASGLSDPAGLAFDAAGNLYVANGDTGTIEEFSPTGADLGTFASGLGNPTGLAFVPGEGGLPLANLEPVPQPSSLTMAGIGLATGLGGLALARFRASSIKRRSSSLPAWCIPARDCNSMCRSRTAFLISPSPSRTSSKRPPSATSACSMSAKAASCAADSWRSVSQVRPRASSGFVSTSRRKKKAKADASSGGWPVAVWPSSVARFG